MSEETKTVKLGDLLPDSALDKICELANAGTYRKCDLMPVLEPHRAELLEKGVLAEYLGYMLEYLLGEFFIYDRSGYCSSCGNHMRMDNSELCQMCQGDLWHRLHN